MRKLFYLLFSFFFLAGCSPSSTDSKEETPETITSYPELMHQVWEAHGGIENWKRFKALTFSVVRQEAGSPEVHQVNLEGREVLINADSFRIGMNDQQVWVAPTLESYDGNARFYHNLWFYFFNIPFLMSDPGVQAEDGGMRTLNGKQYLAVNVGFEDGIGDAADDQYILLIDPENKKMEWLLYTVTYFINEESSEYYALHYQDYQAVDGLQMPASLTGHTYANDTTGQVRYSVMFTDVSFSDEPYPEKAFLKPVAGEYTED